MGDQTPPGAYVMADQTYVRLVDSLARDQIKFISPELPSDLLSYYRGPGAPIVA
jgi:hypothetical protein